MRGALVVILLLFVTVNVVFAQSGNFPTSLHKTRAGKDYWYGTANGGFELFTGIPIEVLGCTECHGPTDANGNPYPDPYPGADCVDCHPASFFPVSQDQCYGCHGRQKTVAQALMYSDVHRDAGMVCWDCHETGDLHGDGTVYNSMLEPGAMDADCENCHPAAGLPSVHLSYDPHGGKLHCTSCHLQSNVSCYNCHFESQVDAHVKRAKQPLHDFVILVNRDKDGKVHPASFQSVTYQGNAFVAFAPMSAHTVTKTGARDCQDCHVNFGGSVPAIDEYNLTGQISFAEWDDVGKTLSWKHGIVPFPEDYESSFKMDFITYDGDPSDPPGPSANWSSIGKNTWDGHQLFFGTPLTFDQMEKLGMSKPLAVAIAMFDVTATKDGVELYSEFVSNLNVQRVNVYRNDNVLETVSDGIGNSFRYLDSAVEPGETYKYRIGVIDNDGEFMSQVREVTIPLSEIALGQNRPNPFNPTTTITYTLPMAQQVSLEIYDATGKLVRRLFNGTGSAGDNSVDWNGMNDSGVRVVSGTYFYKITAGNFQATRKMVLLK